MATPRPDLQPESEVKQVPIIVIVQMRGAGVDFADASSVLGLGQGDLVSLSIPSFQRGLKWGVNALWTSTIH